MKSTYEAQKTASTRVYLGAYGALMWGDSIRSVGFCSALSDKPHDFLTLFGSCFAPAPCGQSDGGGVFAFGFLGRSPAGTRRRTHEFGPLGPRHVSPTRFGGFRSVVRFPAQSLTLANRRYLRWIKSRSKR